jgi:hypothetical protein
MSINTLHKGDDDDDNNDDHDDDDDNNNNNNKEPYWALQKRYRKCQCKSTQHISRAK